MATANDSSKRRRLLGDASLDAGCLSNLPSGILTHVANYLAPPSRALFAAALTNQNSAASDERNTAIVGNEWTTLDFGDIEKELAEKLNDDDIEKVLICIDAANRVKKLKLTNCINITGVGLEPLRGSTIIEQIDLSLVGDHQDPRLSPRPPITCEFVVPILDSIIEREGCSLRHLQFPSVWGWRVTSIQFEEFHMRYNEMLVNRGGSCINCNTHLPSQDGSWIDNNCLQKYTCYECLKHYCEDCTNDDGDYMLFHCCCLCKKRLCTDCQKKKWCIGCEVDYCVGCMDFTDCSGSGCYADICKDCIESSHCFKCGGYFCENCGDQVLDQCHSCTKNCCRTCAEEHDYDWPECRLCEKSFCDDCNEKNGTDAIRLCDDCDMRYCRECRVYAMCHDLGGNKNCAGCIQLTGPFLLEEVKKVRKENKEVKAENKRLKDTNGRMHDHINYLEKQLQREA
eukprot:scaffold2901_cov91-Skeletonema_dohrnii-CCMP3373.AAC.4